MSTPRLFGLAVICAASLWATSGPSAAETVSALRHISLDENETYRVRDLELTRGDLKLYLTEGVLSFFTPVVGKPIAALFTTAAVDAGDAELIVMPPSASERASLAFFAKTPNLDEHLRSVLLLFSDDTANELRTQLHRLPVRRAPEVAEKIGPQISPLVQAVSEQMDLRVVQTLLDGHPASDGFFYGIALGSTLGGFEFSYEPGSFEPVSLGRVRPKTDANSNFEVWTSFRPRRAAPYLPAPARQSDYRIDATIRPDLTMAVTAQFRMRVEAQDGRVLAFALSDRLKVTHASIDGRPAEILQRDSAGLGEFTTGGTFLLVAADPLQPGIEHEVSVDYEGSVIRRASDGSYFVDDRNAWYPVDGTTHSQFDLTFHIPQELTLVATGEPVASATEGGMKTVHRRTQNPERLAGFNLGRYELSSVARGPYQVESYRDATSPTPQIDLSSATADMLEEYTRRWLPLPLTSVAVSPIAGYFGQGFPGLIYLSNIAYLRPEDRPAPLRSERSELFFSDMLLPHEVAHQWWGNMVAAADYRAGWLVEAMANYSALQFVEQKNGHEAVESILNRYREDLLHVENGQTVESRGPVDFGLRLLQNASSTIWRIVVYEKGTWILHMLRERMGDANFRSMQLELLRQFANRPLTNEEFRKVASGFVPAGQPDRDLRLFFETWVYGTGIPKLTLTPKRGQVELAVGAVDSAFSVDIPFQCGNAVRWVRADQGEMATNLPSSCMLPSPSQFLYFR